jgi:Sigma-70, region 4
MCRESYTLSEVAVRLRVTPSRISQLKHTAIGGLRIAVGVVSRRNLNPVIGETGRLDDLHLALM